MRMLALLLALAQVTGAPVRGVVHRSGTDTAVAGVRVLLVRVEGDVKDARLRVTDGDGRFALEEVPAGVYRLFAEHDDFVRPAPVPVTVREGAPVPIVGIAMVPTGVITGRVLDSSAEPVSSVYVRAERKDRVWETQTNDLGAYRLFGLPPGAYVVSAAPYLPPRIEGDTYIRPTPPSPYSRGEGQAMISLSRMLEAGEFIDPRALARARQVRVFYPGTEDAATAAPIEVRPGEVVAAIDIVLR